MPTAMKFVGVEGHPIEIKDADRTSAAIPTQSKAFCAELTKRKQACGMQNPPVNQGGRWKRFLNAWTEQVFSKASPFEMLGVCAATDSSSTSHTKLVKLALSVAGAALKPQPLDSVSRCNASLRRREHTHDLETSHRVIKPELLTHRKLLVRLSSQTNINAHVDEGKDVLEGLKRNTISLCVMM